MRNRTTTNIGDGSENCGLSDAVASTLAAARRRIRISAVGDLHYDPEHETELRDMIASLDDRADVLVLCGDLTTHGSVDQMCAFAELLASVTIPIVAVLGNHDYEADAVEEVTAVLRVCGVHVLDGDHVEVAGVGFAGVKGFGGGFGRGMLGPFGEPEYKQLVQRATDESLKLENAFRRLETTVSVAVLHYAPIPGTLAGEPEMIYPFLGTSRLLPPIETYRPDVVFHGHAHTGTVEGVTPSGIPVYNVSLPLLRRRGQSFHNWTVAVPSDASESDARSPYAEDL